MGCVSSKLLKKQLHQDVIVNNGGGLSVNHVVSLTSSTYGALKLDINEKWQGKENQEEEHREGTEEEEEEGERKEEEGPIKEIVAESKRSPSREEPEVINAWELMEGLEDGVVKKSPKSKAALFRGFVDVDARSPLKFLNQIGSPRKAKTFGGKENKVRRMSDFSPRPVFKANSSPAKSSKAVMRLSYPTKASPMRNKTEILGVENSAISSRRMSFSPLFDPELVALYERELTEEEEQIKRIISLTPKNHHHKLKNSSELNSILTSFEEKCPPGGENAVVFYTTTLRGIRKTFEDCNKVRSIIESHHIQMLERDISMDSGLKEELRTLMGTKQVKVPLVFIKGRLIGGADQVMKLEEEGKLGNLFDGIPKGLAVGCEGCGGIRFVMCMDCNGSCKVLDLEQKKMVKCGKCNENGLIQCPLCLSF